VARPGIAPCAETYPPLEVPVVTVHPETHKRVIRVNALYTTSICGVSREQSAALLAMLTGLARVPEWQIRFHWNRARSPCGIIAPCKHYAVTTTPVVPADAPRDDRLALTHRGERGAEVFR